jgi:uncharacterized membrane protein YhaH (DUF805 family)
MTENNPYQTPAATVADPDDVEYGEIRPLSPQGGLGRVRYIAYATVVTLAMYALMAAGGMAGALGSAGALIGGPLMFAVMIGAAVISVLLAIQRLHDFDASGWWSVAMVVPLVNMILTIALLFVPGTSGANRYGPQTPPNTTRLTILAALFPLIFVAGIVAAIAIPAYQDYTERAAAAGSPLGGPVARSGPSR